MPNCLESGRFYVRYAASALSAAFGFLATMVSNERAAGSGVRSEDEAALVRPWRKSAVRSSRRTSRATSSSSWARDRAPQRTFRFLVVASLLSGSLSRICNMAVVRRRMELGARWQVRLSLAPFVQAPQKFIGEPHLERPILNPCPGGRPINVLTFIINVTTNLTGRTGGATPARS